MARGSSAREQRRSNEPDRRAGNAEGRFAGLHRVLAAAQLISSLHNQYNLNESCADSLEVVCKKDGPFRGRKVCERTTFRNAEGGGSGSRHVPASQTAAGDIRVQRRSYLQAIARV
jgi:hypothetical protein